MINDGNTVTITRKISVHRDQLPKDLVSGMIDSAFNPMSWIDGYTYAAWRSEYGEDMIEAVRQLVIEPMRLEREQHETALNDITRRYS